MTHAFASMAAAEKEIPFVSGSQAGAVRPWPTVRIISLKSNISVFILLMIVTPFVHIYVLLLWVSDCSILHAMAALSLRCSTLKNHAVKLAGPLIVVTSYSLSKFQVFSSLTNRYILSRSVTSV